MNMATIHAVGPSYVVGQHSKNAVDVPCIEAVIDALQNLDVVSHQHPLLSIHAGRSGTRVATGWPLLYIGTYA